MYQTKYSEEVEATVQRIKTMDRKFKRACSNILMLNQRIEDKQARYSRAYRINQRSWRYTLRLQLATMEGMRNMFYEYAHRHADELEILQHSLVQAGVLSEDEDEQVSWSDIEN